MERAANNRLLIYVGSLGPLGFVPASGTITVLVVGIPLFWVSRSIPLIWYVPAVLAFVLASVWVHQRGDAALGSKDSRVLVWDEVAGFLIAVTGVPFTWQTALLAFLLERGLDILKIAPAKWVEDHWPGGWGVVGDDVVAGLYTLAVLQILLRVAPSIMV